MSIAISAAEVLPLGADEFESEPVSATLRSTLMRLVWVCGDCGEHYARHGGCPAVCKGCGAPRENFYAPVED